VSIRSLAAVLLLALACSPEPAEVWVPGPGFEQTIHITSAQGDRATVRVGEPLVLHAERRSGPWVRRARATLAPDDSCWLRSPPSSPEPEVAGSLRWLVDPPGSATFNLDLRTDATREVRFSEPGVYRLATRGSGWCGEPDSADTITVEVAHDADPGS